MQCLQIDTEKPADTNKLVMLNDAFFNLYVAHKELSDLSIKAIEFIDNAKYLDNGLLMTKDGAVAIEHLSTGCKTAINLIEDTEHVFYLGESGTNAINFIVQNVCGITYIDYPCYLTVDNFNVFLNTEMFTERINLLERMRDIFE